MTRTPGFVQNREPKVFAAAVDSLHVVEKAMMSPMRLQAVASRPERLLREQPLCRHDFNFVEEFTLESGGELVLPQHFLGHHAVLVVSGVADIQTQVRGGVCASRLHVGQVAFTPISHARLPTRTTVIASGRQARIVLAALNPAQFC